MMDRRTFLGIPLPLAAMFCVPGTTTRTRPPRGVAYASLPVGAWFTRRVPPDPLRPLRKLDRLLAVDRLHRPVRVWDGGEGVDLYAGR